MVECGFRDIRRVSRLGERMVEQVCLIGKRGPMTIGSNEDEANRNFCSRCEVPEVMNTEHCKYLIPQNTFTMGPTFVTSYKCQYWNESLGYKEKALEKCSECDDYSAV